jgi:hypothetical protein
MPGEKHLGLNHRASPNCEEWNLVLVDARLRLQGGSVAFAHMAQLVDSSGNSLCNAPGV